MQTKKNTFNTNMTMTRNGISSSFFFCRFLRGRLIVAAAISLLLLSSQVSLQASAARPLAAAVRGPTKGSFSTTTATTPGDSAAAGSANVMVMSPPVYGAVDPNRPVIGKGRGSYYCDPRSREYPSCRNGRGRNRYCNPRSRDPHCTPVGHHP